MAKKPSKDEVVISKTEMVGAMTDMAFMRLMAHKGIADGVSGALINYIVTTYETLAGATPTATVVDEVLSRMNSGLSLREEVELHAQEHREVAVEEILAAIDKVDAEKPKREKPPAAKRGGKPNNKVVSFAAKKAAKDKL